jgi:hypothetical protein
LRQGSSLSPLLFNLVVDVFSRMLSKAANNGYITGFWCSSYPKGVPSLQYVDDPLVFLSCDVRQHATLSGCDRTTSKMRSSYPKIISGDSRRSENAQTHTYKHTVPNMKSKLKLLQIKCHVLGFTKDNQSFCGSVHLSQ